jgi:hypothetical protein
MSEIRHDVHDTLPGASNGEARKSPHDGGLVP